MKSSTKSQLLSALMSGTSKQLQRNNKPSFCHFSHFLTYFDCSGERSDFRKKEVGTQCIETALTREIHSDIENADISQQNLKSMLVRGVILYISISLRLENELHALRCNLQMRESKDTIIMSRINILGNFRHTYLCFSAAEPNHNLLQCT